MAATASSTRNFFSSISVSVAPPTFITATLPSRLARRFSRSSLSNSLVASAICWLIWAMRALTAAGLPAPSIIVVSSLVTITFRAEPIASNSTSSKLIPCCSLITCAPVRMAMSSRRSVRLSPKLGALTATVLNTPLSLLRINVPSASPSTSSAMITRSFLPA